ncbi:MAG: OmpA family protein [Pseudomonadota bacterium]
MNTLNKVTPWVAGVSTLVLTFGSVTAGAASPRENRGVLGGAVVGAIAGGPVGLIAGAALGGHYANRSERIEDGNAMAIALNEQLDDINARLAASTLALQQVETTLSERNARVDEQSQRIEALTEDQMLLSALALRVRFATGDATLSEDDHEILAILGHYLERHPEIRVQLDGHADGRGPAPDNLSLSRTRAEAVGEALVKSRAHASQIDVTAHGEKAATARADDPDQLATERRVEIRLVTEDPNGPRSAAVE